MFWKLFGSITWPFLEIPGDVFINVNINYLNPKNKYAGLSMLSWDSNCRGTIFQIIQRILFSLIIITYYILPDYISILCHPSVQ